MGLNQIEIEPGNKTVSITNEARVQMFAGDPGTTVWATVELSLDELCLYIDQLTLTRDTIRG